MKKNLAICILFLVLVSQIQCSSSDQRITVKNNSNVNFSTTAVEIYKKSLNEENQANFENLGVYNTANNQFLLTQKTDSNNDGINDKLIFQPQVQANSTQSYELRTFKGEVEESKVYSRFVPERTDDYAWENDKVAFRTYGPTAQKMVEDRIPGGTLSSGMDCWLKKVDYPVINKWYKKFSDGTGTYHEDTGEGLDNFHVGTTRGCGGLGVFLNDELYTSKNFTNYKTTASGPIRTAFTLDYEDWKAEDLSISEQKNISLDLGSNLMKIDAEISGSNQITVGLTLHENDGVVSVDTVSGWFSYWQPHGGSELGTGILINPEHYIGYKKVESNIPDKSQLLVHIKVVDGHASYLTGFAWKESGQYPSKEEWEKYLSNEAAKLQSPLEVHIQ